jgi:aldose sugar dehydrogenase
MSKRTLVVLVAAAAAVVLVAGGVSAIVLLGGEDPVDERPEQTAPAEEGEEEEDTEPPAAEPVVETVVDGLRGPWGLAFLPDQNQVLVTQIVGTLSLVDVGTGAVRDIDGVPDVADAGQGGLLDVAIHPDFPDPAWVYLTYSAGDGSGATTTHLARGILDADRERLTDLEVLFVAEPFRQGNAHYGSRVVFGADGHLYMSIGDRGDKNFGDHPSQDTSNTLGSTIRLAPDGAIPDDNPFVDDPGVADEIYSYGHRNVQGMTVHPQTGDIWQSEHGERDGDSINISRAGGNHGWPVAHTGCLYGTNTPVGDHPADRDDIVDPVHYWECGTGGFPPAGMTFYYGDEFPTWEGDLLVGGLATEYLARFTVDGRSIDEAEPLLADEGWRIRDVEVSPHDGAIYVAVDGSNAPLVRLVNAAGG